MRVVTTLRVEWLSSVGGLCMHAVMRSWLHNQCRSGGSEMTNEETCLRLISVDDAAELAELVQANREHLRPWEPTRDPSYYTEKTQYELIEIALNNSEAGVSVPFVIESDRGEILGRLTLSGITRGALQSCALSYWVRVDRLRRGYATRAASEAAHYAFEVLGLHRMQAETLPENVASQEVVKRVGFTVFGVAPKYLRINGEWRDHVMFQLLNAAFE